MQRPPITVGIPVYNAEKYLSACIGSVLKQTFRDFRLIIVNDGSTDKSLQIIMDFMRKDPRIELVNDGENKGLIARLNALVDNTDSEFFVRMDADDIMFPERLQKQLELMRNDSATEICHSSAVSIDKNNRVLGLKKAGKVESSAKVLSGVLPIHPTVMGRTSFFRKNRYRSGFHQMEDMELWYRTADQNKFTEMSEPLLFYREDSVKNSGKHRKMYSGLEKFVNEYIADEGKACAILKASVRKRKIYTILENLHLEHLLLRRRYTKIDDKQKYQHILDRIIM